MCPNLCLNPMESCDLFKHIFKQYKHFKHTYRQFDVEIFSLFAQISKHHKGHRDMAVSALIIADSIADGMCFNQTWIACRKLVLDNIEQFKNNTASLVFQLAFCILNGMRCRQLNFFNVPTSLEDYVVLALLCGVQQLQPCPCRHPHSWRDGSSDRVRQPCS